MEKNVGFDVRSRISNEWDVVKLNYMYVVSLFFISFIIVGIP